MTAAAAAAAAAAATLWQLAHLCLLCRHRHSLFTILFAINLLFIVIYYYYFSLRLRVRVRVEKLETQVTKLEAGR